MKKIKNFFKRLGPGFITGASDDDPSGIATYSQTGAVFGYKQLWTTFFVFPFMVVVQEICGRIGMVTGKGLAGVIKINYPKRILFTTVFILFFANTVNIGANLGAMAASLELLINLPFIFWLIVVTILIVVLEVFISYKTYAKFLKLLTLSLFAYIITAFLVKQDWPQILKNISIPYFSFDRSYLLNIVAILGTTISPYLFFWQAGEEVEEEVEHHKLRMMGKGSPRISKKDIREMRWDTTLGMLFSQIVTFFIIITTASTLNKNEIFNIQTADQAALALRPLAGEFTYLIFAIGIVGTGLLAVPILAGSASYAISESFGWKEGLYRKFGQAKGFYEVIIIATLVGVLINLTPIKPFQMLYYTAVLNGIAAPILLVMIMLIANNKKIMGNHTNSKFSNIFGWGITFVMLTASITLILNFFLH